MELHAHRRPHRDTPNVTYLNTARNLSNDTDTAVPASWDITKDRQYKSFVSVPVRAEGVAFGMLTANTLETDGFSNSDVASIKVLAHLLAAAEATTMTPARIARAVQRRGN
ncbi:GAF domain-containing protein [Mycolicibacterium doricum]|uniref:GAF domain-containing protein n=1 Tax=Mycolicibacterium doricum TaxID=126673 RepID=UPI0030B8F47E